MTWLTVFSALLLVSYPATICKATGVNPWESTSSQLNEEINIPIHRPYADESLVETVRVAVSESVEDILLPWLSKLFIPGYTPSQLACSCKEILQLAPQSPSGYYYINGTDGRPLKVYCDMERTCKGVTGGWMRVALIDMTNSSSSCPTGLSNITAPRRLCAKNIDGPGCSTVVFPVYGVEYSQVCGKIVGYQKGSPDAFRRVISGQDTIDTNYVDGISMTYGKYPRKHIWTFTAALQEESSERENVCPCTSTRSSPQLTVPDFVREDYFCDTGSRGFHQNILYRDDPLWDGTGCEYNTPPWFRKEISPPTRDDIEVRLCADEGLSNENINFEKLEIYVQ